MHQQFLQLTPELWLTQSRSFHMNSGLVISQGEACLIDPGVHPDEMDGLAQFAAGRGAKPTLIILTHWHWDHILGPERFPGVPVAAHPLYADEVARNRPGLLAEVAGWDQRAGVERGVPFSVPQPDRVLDDGAKIEFGRVELHLKHVPGHSADQLAIYLPDRAALWASDILSDTEIPFVSDSLASYERTLAGLAELEINVLAPGHGSPACHAAVARTRIDEDRAYLAALRRNVDGALRAGLSVEATVAACASMDYRLPADNDPYHRLNVESAYLELGGAADPARVGWLQDWPTTEGQND